MSVRAYHPALIDYLRDWSIEAYSESKPDAELRHLGEIGLILFRGMVELSISQPESTINFGDYRTVLSCMRRIASDEIQTELLRIVEYWKSNDEPVGVHETSIALLQYPRSRYAAFLDLLSLPVDRLRIREREFLLKGAFDSECSLNLEPKELYELARECLNSSWQFSTTATKRFFMRQAKTILTNSDYLGEVTA